MKTSTSLFAAGTACIACCAVPALGVLAGPLAAVLAALAGAAWWMRRKSRRPALPADAAHCTLPAPERTPRARD